MRTIEEMSRKDLVVLYTIGICDQLIKEGVVSGGQYALDVEGKKLFDHLNSIGFKPTKEEIESVIDGLDKLGKTNKILND